MPQLPVTTITNEFPFLDDRTAQEPFLYEVLCEIKRCQKEGYAKGNDSFASRETIFTTRTITMPISPAREKNLEYILELLLKLYPNNITMIPSFDFKFDDESKKLALIENEEFTFNLGYEDIEKIKASRDKRSIENFTQFIRKFRLFNLDKVVKRARNRADLGKVIDQGLNKNFFTYKHYFMEKKTVEAAEDYCFHAENYEHVKKSLNLMVLRTFIATYNELVRSRLRKFGIMNTDFTDYRDSKIEYILSVLLNDLSAVVTEKDMVEIKNFKALRDCILAVDKILDPAKTKNADILAFIRSQKIASADDIISGVMGLTRENLESWDKSDLLLKEHIFKHDDQAGILYYFDGTGIANLFHASLANLKNIETLKPGAARDKCIVRTDLLYKSARQILHYSNAQAFVGSEQDVLRLSRLSDEYEAYIKKMTVESEMHRAVEQTPAGSGSIIRKILSFFASLFTGGSGKSGVYEDHAMDDALPIPDTHEKMEPGRETKEINEKAAARRGPVVALSDLIEFKPDNENLINRIITELRANNMRLVVPIYNARSILYPKRSSKLLMSDVEYLLVPIQVIKSMDTISEYLNSLMGYKLKDEIIPGNALLAIEKYLRIIYRQRRSSQVRKKDMREKSMRP
jgi:hypothetical protein